MFALIAAVTRVEAIYAMDQLRNCLTDMRKKRGASFLMVACA
jgi:hypothetical protein